MPRKIVAQTPRGTFTRRSDRPYTHIVVAGGLLESHVRQSFTHNRVGAAAMLKEYRAVVASGRVPAGFGMLTLDNYRKYILDLETRLTQLTPEAEQAKVDLEASQFHGAFGWSQSAQNAEKMADQARKTRRDVEIFEVAQ